MGQLNNHNELTINGKAVRSITNEKGQKATFTVTHNETFRNEMYDLAWTNTQKSNFGSVEMNRLYLNNQDDAGSYESDYTADGTYGVSQDIKKADIIAEQGHARWIQDNESNYNVLNRHWRRLGVIKNYKKYDKLDIEIAVYASLNSKNGDTHKADIDEFLRGILGATIIKNGADNYEREHISFPQRDDTRLDSRTFRILPKENKVTEWYPDDLLGQNKIRMSMPNGAGHSFPPFFDNNGGVNGANDIDLTGNVCFWHWVYQRDGVNDFTKMNGGYGIWFGTKNMFAKKSSVSSNFLNNTFENVDPENDLVFGILPYYYQMSGEDGVQLIASNTEINTEWKD